nr:MAG TPA: hypothetical protein [Caudoviricetes sp.]
MRYKYNNNYFIFLFQDGCSRRIRHYIRGISNSNNNS